MPTYLALCKHWRTAPPAYLQLRRIALAVGIQPDVSAGVNTVTDPVEIERAVAAAGFPVHSGRPNDPMLDLIDEP